MKNKDTQSRFDVPQLPYMQIITTFAVPLLVAVVPTMIDRTTTLKDTVIIALIALAVLLFVLWLTTYMRLYDESFCRQVIEFKLDIVTKDAEVFGEQMKNNSNELKELKSALERFPE